MNNIERIDRSFSPAHLLLMFSIVLLGLSGCEGDETQTVATFNRLVVEEEFNADGPLDESKWNADLGIGNSISGDGWGNNELQYYTDRPENLKIQDGLLHITAHRENYMGASYTSARINSLAKIEQTYGRFEAKIQLPWGQGLWPAFWLLGTNIEEVGWPECGEIDIMEYRGQNPSILLGSVHGPGYFAGESVGKEYVLEQDRFDTGFHVFGIEWGPEYINYYVDDVLYNQITPEDVDGDWVFDGPVYIILNLAVGGDFVGAPNATTVFPQTMLVDYVRVYQQ